MKVSSRVSDKQWLSELLQLQYELELSRFESQPHKARLLAEHIVAFLDRYPEVSNMEPELVQLQDRLSSIIKKKKSLVI